MCKIDLPVNQLQFRYADAAAPHLLPGRLDFPSKKLYYKMKILFTIFFITYLFLFHFFFFLAGSKPLSNSLSKFILSRLAALAEVGLTPSPVGVQSGFFLGVFSFLNTKI